MNFTYDDIHELAGKNAMYPVQSACRKLVEQGMRDTNVEIYPNNNEDGDGLPDVIYPSIMNAARDGNAKYLQKGKDYACWYPIAEKKKRKQGVTISGIPHRRSVSEEEKRDRRTIGNHANV